MEMFFYETKIFPNLGGLIAILIEQHRGSFWLTFRTKGGKCRVTRYVIENLFIFT